MVGDPVEQIRPQDRKGDIKGQTRFITREDDLMGVEDENSLMLDLHPVKNKIVRLGLYIPVVPIYLPTLLHI